MTMFPSEPMDESVIDAAFTAQPGLPAELPASTPDEKKDQLAPVAFRNGELVTDTLEGAQRIALGYCMSGWYPAITNGARSDREKIARMMIVIATGRQLGLTDHAAASNLTPINGRLSLWGDSLVAIVRRSPTCHSIDCKLDRTTKTWTVTGKRIRPDGTLDEVTHTFSMEDAKECGYLNKGGVWKTNPLRMCQNRARGYVIRDLWADLLCGVTDLDEEIEIEEVEKAERQDATGSKLAAIAAPQ